MDGLQLLIKDTSSNIVCLHETPLSHNSPHPILRDYTAYFYNICNNNTNQDTIATGPPFRTAFAPACVNFIFLGDVAKFHSPKSLLALCNLLIEENYVHIFSIVLLARGKMFYSCFAISAITMSLIHHPIVIFSGAAFLLRYAALPVKSFANYRHIYLHMKVL
uniref:Uncharacterized protein n=1 Tax=Glossina austeni TaxID=7395 RepID=A0A1A9UIB2_GLOAU